MFIQTEKTPNPNSLKFIPGKTVSNSGQHEITKKNFRGFTQKEENFKCQMWNVKLMIGTIFSIIQLLIIDYSGLISIYIYLDASRMPPTPTKHNKNEN